MVGDGVKGGFALGDGLVELGDFCVDGDDAGAERFLDDGAEGEEAFAVEGLSVAKRVPTGVGSWFTVGHIRIFFITFAGSTPVSFWSRPR